MRKNVFKTNLGQGKAKNLSELNRKVLFSSSENFFYVTSLNCCGSKYTREV